MNIPLSLYIHIPWCIKKCPYCDFNSHANDGKLPEAQYLQALLQDLSQSLEYVQNRPIQTIFFGGGTPSLFSPKGLESLLQNISQQLEFAHNTEITLETNPGTAEHFNLADYKSAGINRISLGAQSFDDHKLKLLGRIHSSYETLCVIEKLHQINFKSFNIDIMHGLPEQTLKDAMDDLQTAIDCNPQHISWYQLTIEPNTIFHKYPPILPQDEITGEIQFQGEELLRNAKYMHYEVSAFAKKDQECQHNINYWEFGDYIGIGAGAHGKISNATTQEITRMWKTRNPKDYLAPDMPFLAGSEIISAKQLPGEYMLNRLRLFKTLNLNDFYERTRINPKAIEDRLALACKKELILMDGDTLTLTPLGRRFLNDLLQLFI